MNIPIYQDEKKNIRIVVNKTYNQEFLKFAEDTLWGTESVLYQMFDLKNDFDKFQYPSYVSLLENDKLIATCVLNQKQINKNNESFAAFYLCILSVAPHKMGKGYGNLIVDKTTSYIMAQFDKVIIYAYVEEENEPSKKIFKKNYDLGSEFIVVSHVKLSLKNNIHVSKLSKEDSLNMQELLKNQYSNHSFVDTNNIIDPNSYYVYKEDGEIKAGFEIKKLRWQFINMLGFEGFLMMKAIPWIPKLNKIFNAKNHVFLVFGNIYINDPKYFSKLIGTVMSINKLNTSLACVDPTSKVDLKILSEMKKGLLSSTDTKVLLYYKLKGVNKEFVKNPQLRPVEDFI